MIQESIKAAALPGVESDAIDVAVLVYDLRGSGVVRNAIRIADAAQRHGLRSQLWVVRADGALASEVPPHLEVVSLSEKNPLLRACKHRALSIVMAVGTLADALRTHRPHVLFSSGNHVHWLAARANAAADYQSRLIMRASNDMFHRQRGWLAAIKQSVRSIVARKFMGHVFGEADHVVAVSRDLACQLRVNLGLRKVSAIPNGVPVGWTTERAIAPLPHPWFAAGEPPVILGIGRLVRQKNFRLLLEAFAKVRKNRRCRLLILGDGSGTARTALRHEALRLGVADDIQLVGFDPNPHRYLARAALFVLSSSWEGSSNALLEALACGCPVVATDCPTGPREVLAHGRFGPLVPIENADALASAMEWRLDQPREAALLQSRAAAFDAERMLAAYASLLACEAGASGPVDRRWTAGQPQAGRRSKAAMA